MIRDGSLLARWTVTPPGGAAAASAPPADTCRPLPTLFRAYRLIAGGGFTVTLTLSDVRLGADAVSVVVHGSVALPPYVTVALAFTWPGTIVMGEVAAAHAGLAGVSVTLIPGEGAAVATP